MKCNHKEVQSEEQQRLAIALNLPSSPAIALQREGFVDIVPTIEKVRYEESDRTL